MVEGTADISNASYPSSVQASTPFDITYDITNVGGTDTLWGGLWDNTTSEYILGTTWAELFNAGQTKSKTISFPNGITTSLSVQLTAGHHLDEICQWVIDHGGATGIDITEVFQMIDSYLYQIPPTNYAFIPGLAETLGIIDYYLGFLAGGDTNTGCNFGG